MNYRDRLIELVKISGETISENASELVSKVPYTTSFGITIHFTDNGMIEQAPIIEVTQGYLPDVNKLLETFRKTED